MNNSDKVYLDMLKKESGKIGVKICKTNSHNHGIIKATGLPTRKIEGLKVRQENVNDVIDDYDGIDNINKFSRHFLDKLDEKADKNEEKAKEIQKQIKKLSDIRDGLTTTKRKSKISKKIEVKQRRIQKLQKANVKIDKKQRVFIMPKKIRDMYRLKLLSKAETKVKIYKDSLRYNKQMMSTIDPDSGLKDALLDFVYYKKEKHYKKKLKHANEILDTMQNANSTIAMKGASLIVLSKGTVDKFRMKNKKSKTGGKSR